MSAVETLTKARDLIARPGGWTQNALARTKAGRAIGPQERPAVCWCALGAYLASGGISPLKLQWALGLDCDVGSWNDAPGRTQAEVVAGFDRAIAVSEAEAA